MSASGMGIVVSSNKKDLIMVWAGVPVHKYYQYIEAKELPIGFIVTIEKRIACKFGGVLITGMVPESMLDPVYKFPSAKPKLYKLIVPATFGREQMGNYALYRV